MRTCWCIQLGSVHTLYIHAPVYTYIYQPEAFSVQYGLPYIVTQTVTKDNDQGTRVPGSRKRLPGSLLSYSLQGLKDTASD